ncbi:PepSY domain-containing protein [Puniceicoccaceae bacterium K14]|nr:PepSY domain-containing protein [Puniceicoccaceae bacterium K14]
MAERESFRNSMRGLHTWSGLVFGWVLYFMFITGATGYFDLEVDRWMKPEIPFVGADVEQSEMLAVAEARLNEIAPDAVNWEIAFPAGRRSQLQISWETPAEEGSNAKPIKGKEFLDPKTGTPYEIRDTAGGNKLYAMHYAFHYLPRFYTYKIASLVAFFMLIALITGVVIHRQFFKDLFTFRPGLKASSWLSAHTMLSVLTLPYLLMITYSGLVFLVFRTMPFVIAAGYSFEEDSVNKIRADVFPRTVIEAADGVKSPIVDLGEVLREAQPLLNGSDATAIEIVNRGSSNSRVEIGRYHHVGVMSKKLFFFDGVTGEFQSEKIAREETTKGGMIIYRILTALHEGQFAGPFLRWIYFVSALAGAGVVASGMILWVSKRRKKAEKADEGLVGLRLVEYLNIGTIAGLPIGISAYFWANRMLPLEMKNRGDWELNVLFIVWAIAMTYPVAVSRTRSIRQAWKDLFFLGAIAYGVLPVLNGLTGGVHLGESIVKGDWVIAGFDLAAIVFALLFGYAALRGSEGSEHSAAIMPGGPLIERESS